MEKRLVVFIVFSLLIIFSYPFFITMMTGKSLNAPITPSETSEKTAGDDRGFGQDQKGNVPTENKPSSAPEGGLSEASAETVAELPEVLKVVESDLYRVTLSSRGGVIKKWELKKYTEKDKETGTEVAIQLVPEGIKLFPLALSLPGETGKTYPLDSTPLQLSASSPEAVVAMVYAGPNGEKITKTFRFSHETYLVGLKLETEGYGQSYALSLGTNFGIHEWGEQIGRDAGGVSLIDNEVVRNIPSKMEESTASYSGKAKWFALEDKYFISALIPKNDSSMGPVSFEKEGEKAISAKVQLKSGSGSSVHDFSLYAGPKEYDRLNALNVNLDESIDFGWFIFGSWLPVRMIAKPIFYLLRFFYQFTHNYGIAIILITVLIKVIFFPITQKSMKSMKSMASIKPKIEAIRKQWAKDKEKMSTELMRLYKSEKVNPLGGCLPIFVQIPVFISLFNILYTTIELRQAPFFFWVTDLSVKDPYYVLPIIMGGTMFLQQYTAPTTMDDTQAKIMMFLPVVYTFFFLNFPSGLVLYWLVNNTLTIAQQYITNKDSKKSASELVRK